MTKKIILLFVLVTYSFLVANAQTLTEVSTSTTNSTNKTTVAPACVDDLLENPDNLSGTISVFSGGPYVEFFDIEAINPIRLHDLSLGTWWVNNGPQIYDVYSIAGGWAGNTGTTVGWTYEGSFSAVFDHEFVGLNMNHLLLAGEKRGFMIIGQTASGASLNNSGQPTTSNAITASNADLKWYGSEIGFVSNLTPITGYTRNTQGAICYSNCTATASFRLYGQNKLWKNAGASDDNMFYYGATQTKRVRANATGGVGPYTYTWSNSEGYQLKDLSADGRTVRLFEPQGPSYMVCEIYDAGANCTFKDSVFVDWTDVFWCGTTGGTSADFWKLTMCVDGVTSCMSQSAAKAALKDPNVTASLGACSTPKANLSSSAIAFVIYPNPSSGLLNINFTSTTEATASIEVVDMNGRVLQTSQIETNIGIVESNLDLSGLANGMYFVRLATENTTSVQKLQIAK